MLAAFLLGMGNVQVVFGQVDSTWIAPSDGNWFDTLNWNAPIPNGAGDIARVQRSALGNVSVDLTSPVTLGHLELASGASFTLTGVDPVLFDDASGGALLEVVRGSPGFPQHRLEVPLDIAAGVELTVDVLDRSFLELAGSIVSQTGNITKIGGGTLELSGDNTNWDGLLTVERGFVAVNHSQALGSTSGNTILQGGTVQVSADLDEPFTLVAGVLETDMNSLVLGGHLTVAGGNTAVVRGPFRIRGGTSGGGDLHLVATGFSATDISEVPLAHEGGLIISSGESSLRFVGIGIDNTYSGPTLVTDVRLNVVTANGLGTTDAGTTVVNGVLSLVPTSREDVRLENSTLSLQLGDTDVSLNRFEGNITLSHSTLNTVAAFSGPSQYTVVRPITLDGGINAIEPEKGALRIEGGIVGIGDLLLNPNRGDPVEVASKIEHQGTLEVRGGPVRFLVPDAYSKTVVVRNGGSLIIESPQTFDRVTTTSNDTPCCSTFGSIEVFPGSSLTANSVEFFQGFIQGNVQTDGPIRFHGFAANRTISNLESGVDVEIYGGELTIDDSDTSRPATNGSISILRGREASILLARDSVTDADVNLNNGSGFNFGGALRTENDGSAIPTITIRGDIDLGAEGAYLGGSDGIRAEGQIRGGDLHLGRLRGNPHLSIVGGPAAYRGKTIIQSGELVLSELGTLANTDRIDISADGALYVDNAISDGPNSDRVADHLQVVLHGGEVTAWPTEWGVDVTERLGTVVLERGQSTLRGTHFFGRGSLESVATLVIGELTRSPGSVLHVSSNEQRSSMEFARVEGPPEINNLVLENPPQLVNGILPAWIRAGRTQFATLGPTGVEPFLGPTVTLDAANATSNVRPGGIDGTIGLTGDKEINSFNSTGSAPSVNLNGHTLTIGSGGLIGARLSQGTILPGENANGELFIASDFVIDADIADNGGPTSVVYSGSGKVGGANTYTGITYVMGRPGDDVRVTSASALPTGGDIEISGYTDLVLRDLSGNTAYQFGTVALRDGGTLIAQCCGNGDTVTADEILLEEGTLAVPLVGNTRVIKNTDGLARMLYSSPGFSGRVDVNHGTLQVGEVGGLRDGYLSLGESEVVVHAGANLVLTPVSTSKAAAAPLPNIMLQGGSLFGAGIPRDFEVNLRGTLEVVEPSRIYLLDGLEADPRVADIKIDGKIHVPAGQSLSVIGIFASSRGLSVSEGFQLDPGSILGGTGSIRARVDISEGAILSPGLISAGTTVGMLNISVPIFSADQEESRLTWGENGRYRWEINDADGLAGAPFGAGWDLVSAGPELLVDATPENPFVIEIVGLDLEGNLAPVKNLQPNTNYRWKIAEVAQINAFVGSIDGFDLEKFAIDVSQLQQFYPQVHASDFWLERDGPAIFLNGVIVPEPSTAILLLGIAAMALAGYRSPRVNKPIY